MNALNSIDEQVNRISSLYTAPNPDYMAKRVCRDNSKSNYIREMQIKFLDKYFSLPAKGDPRRKQYIEAIIYN